MESMEKKIDSLFQLWKDNPGAGGQVLVKHKGEVIFEKCYGYANIETQTPMTPESIFHVASTSKPFTAMSVMILHERGLLSINDDVRKYIPDLIQFSQPLTIKQMLNHVSGLRGYYELMYLGGRSNEDHYAQHEIRRLIGRQKTLNFAPGSRFLYTNANFMLAATIVERVSGMSLNDFVTENIFRPLGMTKSFIRDNPRRIIPNKANSYHDNGYEYTNAILTFGIYGGTSLHTTCRDLSIFLQQYRNPTLISRESLETIVLNPPEINGKKSHYALGIMIGDLDGHRFFHHGGVNAGYRTAVQIYPEDNLTVCLFANTYNIPVEYAAKDMARIVLGLPERVPLNLDKYETDTVSLENVAGVYYCDKNGSHCTIDVQDGKVYLDGVYMTHVRGNLFKQGRLDTWLAIGPEIVRKTIGTINQLRKIDAKPTAEYVAKCVGEYYCEDAQGHFEIACENGDFMIRHLRFPAHTLHLLEGDTFFYSNCKITFLWDDAGNVTGYLFNSAHLKDVKFVKVK